MSPGRGSISEKVVKTQIVRLSGTLARIDYLLAPEEGSALSLPAWTPALGTPR